jgi:hypothetical protein
MISIDWKSGSLEHEVALKLGHFSNKHLRRLYNHWIDYFDKNMHCHFGGGCSLQVWSLGVARVRWGWVDKDIICRYLGMYVHNKISILKSCWLEYSYV